jgi:hypothetical protein
MESTFISIAVCMLLSITGASRVLVPKQETNMSKKLKLAFLAAVMAMISISSPVLAAGYDDPALNGGGSSGYNVGNGIH